MGVKDKTRQTIPAETLLVHDREFLLDWTERMSYEVYAPPTLGYKGV